MLSRPFVGQSFWKTTSERCSGHKSTAWSIFKNKHTPQYLVPKSWNSVWSNLQMTPLVHFPSLYLSRKPLCWLLIALFELCVNGILEHILFYIWLLFLNLIFVRINHVVLCRSGLFILLSVHYFIIWIYKGAFILLLKTLKFPVFTIMNSQATWFLFMPFRRLTYSFLFGVYLEWKCYVRWSMCVHLWEIPSNSFPKLYQVVVLPVARECSDGSTSSLMLCGVGGIFISGILVGM